MEKWRFERVKKVLKDYNDTEKYIEQIMQSIRTPYKETDINADIKGTKVDSDTMFNELWTIETHRALKCLKRNKRIVKQLLEECGSDTETIIRELYIKKFPRYTMQGLVMNHKVNCGRNKAIKLRDLFFEEMDKELDK
ncbi:integrase [Enterococcus dongliensis]|uniref:integrase n=1 Tax=Enterococcus dongliensis TaxID=2559925 RepID=UPI00288E6297|nr:integrase [Enterococcus dongliensis]MDT2640653.1 integrase [Enterococcus dongliensis]